MVLRTWVILTFLTGLSLPSFGITWKVVGACNAQAIEEGTSDVDLKKSVFESSKNIFDDNEIPYEIDYDHFSSILSSPSGEAAIEVVDKMTTRYYHWCSMVNGALTYVSPAEVLFSKQTDVLIWYFGYTEYFGHRIITDCAPAFKVQSSSRFCTK